MLKPIQCIQRYCPGCQATGFLTTVTEAGLLSLTEPDYDSVLEVDITKWDALDSAFGKSTRKIVQRVMAITYGSCFSYYPSPSLYMEDEVPNRVLESARLSGATIERDHHLILMRWDIPPPCGLPLSDKGLWLSLDLPPWRQLRKEAEDYCRNKGKPIPKADALLRCAKNTARHQHTSYDYPPPHGIRKTLAARGGLTSRGRDAIRSAFDEVIEKTFPHLRGV